MNSSNLGNTNKKYFKIIGALLIFVFILVILIMALLSAQNNISKNEIITSVLEDTNWPINDVPMIVKNGISVSGDLTNIYDVSCSDEVTYPEIRSYLIELYNSGFKPVEAFGCQNPNNLKTSIDDAKQKELLWIAEKDNYTVSILWAQKGALNELGTEYEYNFEMNLFVKDSL